MSCVQRSDDPDTNAAYLAWLRAWASQHSDGCTGVLDIHVDCCYQHDFCYHTHLDPFSVFQGHPVAITRVAADHMFRGCNEGEDVLGRFSPLAWWRWVGVRLFGGRFFHHNG